MKCGDLSLETAGRSAGSGFVETPSLRAAAQRALAYLKCGYPVHFSGPCGVGKTSLALHVASCLGRPVAFLQGDSSLESLDLVGGLRGLHRRKVIDEYVRGVRRLEEDLVRRWADSWLATACRHGYTLVYDEFTRSRPEANNVLLSVLEERVLVLPDTTPEVGFVPVHPDFRALFTSNPKEYAGVYGAQDALRDRLVTIRLQPYAFEEEVAIASARSGLPPDQARQVVQVIASARADPRIRPAPTVRASIVVCRLLASTGRRPRPVDDFVLQVYGDALGEAKGVASFLKRLAEADRSQPGAAQEGGAEPRPPEVGPSEQGAAQRDPATGEAGPGE
ncbi:MAG: gas vesicle protein GvpN [Acetobacteraceae bacterium]|nr:gas vesicle protein GvpN [Acetobacteraceae bacterium]